MKVIKQLPGLTVVMRPVVAFILAFVVSLLLHVPGSPVCSINMPVVSLQQSIEGPVITGIG